MSNKLDQIFKLVDEYIQEKHLLKTWTPGKDWIQYSGPHYDSNEYVSAIKSLLNEWLILGEDALRFEQQFPKLLGKQFGVVTNSGSSSNLIMMSALTSEKLYKFGPKTKILVPIAGFPTTLNPILQNNFTPVFCDIELKTLNINIEQAETILSQSNDIKAITFAHVLGNPPNMNKIIELVRKYNLVLLEDCCDALGSTYNGELLGSFGDFASCSFYPAHHITMGEGGFVACKTHDEEQVIRSFREWGRGCYCTGKKANLLKKGTCGCRFSKWIDDLPDEIFDHKYIYDEIGYNLKPIELQCAIGLEQIKKLPEIHKKRKKNHRKLYDMFSKYEEFFILPTAQELSDPSWFAFALTIKNNVPFKRSDICNFLENKKIQTRVYFGGNLLLQPAYKNLRQSKEYALSFKNATKTTTDTFFLGTSPVITNKQMDYIKECVDEFFGKV